MEPLRIGLAGLGTVGSGVARLLSTQQDVIAARCGRPVVITAACVRSPSKVRNLPVGQIQLVTEPQALLHQPSVDVVVEVIGGAEGAARELVESALKAGKPVITANKALLAKHGLALARLAEGHRSVLFWEAAVAGGLPIIKLIREGLAANRILRIDAILNGTCNYVLTAMAQQGLELTGALAEAQAHGYAEADPAADLDGVDTAQKLALLAALAFGVPPDVLTIPTTGIRAIARTDIQAAAAQGQVIKLLARARRTEDGLDLRVQPCRVPLSSALGQTHGVNNAVLIQADCAGPVFCRGAGAGAEPTASAVIADIIDFARGNRPATFGVPWAALRSPPLLPVPDDRLPLVNDV